MHIHPNLFSENIGDEPRGTENMRSQTKRNTNMWTRLQVRRHARKPEVTMKIGQQDHRNIKMKIT